jgi:tRNA (uracil-5-)-methyltransferase
MQVASERFSQDILRTRRYADVDVRGYELDTVLVDPPRGGLDKATLRLLRGFPDIIYVSCNPVSLAANMERLSRTHDVMAFAAFDHFPYTDFIESVLHLRKRRKPDQNPPGPV